MKFILVFLLVYASLSYAEVYKWIDETGRVHYGDSPKHVEKVERVTINSYESVTYERNSASEGVRLERVTMYGTSWCGYCRKAREYFMRNNVDFVEYDIEKDAKAQKAYKRLGAKGVPVILVGDKRMNSFSVSGFERIYR